MSVVAASVGQKARRGSVLALNDSNPMVPYLFLVPFFLFFLVFTVYPVIFGGWVSFHRYDPLMETQPYVGLENYARLFDPSAPQSGFFWRTLLNTAFFTAVSVPLLIAVSLMLAVLLHKPIFGRAVFRAIFFMPGILSVSVMGILWKWMFDNQSGLINIIRDQYLHLPTLPFITTEWLAWVPIVIGTVWWTIGFNMTLYLAALGNISQSYYEAASIDGATPWEQFRHITLPLLAPTTLFVGVTTVLASFQLFGQSQVITGGGPTRTTQSVIMYITEEAFSNNQFSSATAMAFVFGLIMLVFTVFQFRLMTRDMRGGA